MTQKIDHVQPGTGDTLPPIWKHLAGMAVFVPFVTLPAFVVGTVFLQDEFINGDGHSWHRAAIRMAVPTGFVTGIACVVALRVCVRRDWRRLAHIVGFILCSLALLFVVYATLAS